MFKKAVQFAAALFVAALVSVTAAIADDVTFDYGASARLRQEIWDNVVSLGTGTTQKDRNFFRLRLSVWGSVDIDKTFDGYVRITSEPKYYLGPYHPLVAPPNPPSPAASAVYFDQNEVIFDNLYASGKLFNGALEFRAGRQDFLSPTDIYGEGFLFMDGTPGDGSRTFYFNAFKARWNITQNNKIDFLYIDDPKTDIFLPSIHPAVSNNSLYVDNKVLLTTSDEQAIAIYSRNKIGDYFTFDPYYIWKIENSFVSGSIVNPKLHLNTVGGRGTFNNEGWKAKAELAYQWGRYDTSVTYPEGLKRSGLGGYAFGGYKFEKTVSQPEFSLGVVYLSGDDPNNKSKREAWDPLFSRNPYWNELYIYTLINETAGKYSGPIPGYWTNMIIYMITARVNLAEKTSLYATYQYLTAPQPSSGLSPVEFTNSGKSRGSLPTLLLAHAFNKNLDGFLQLEYFIPGNFYTSATKDALFFRWQLNFKI